MLVASAVFVITVMLIHPVATLICLITNHRHLSLAVQLVINTGYLFDPRPAFVMFQLKYFLARPVEIIGNIGYLLPELVERVARYSPDGTNSTSNW